MATEPDDEEELTLDDPIDTDEDDVDADERDDEPAGDDEGGDETDEAGEADEEVLTFGDDLADEKEDDSSLIRHLRAELKRTREEARRMAAPKPEPIEVGPEPTLADCDYDEDKFKAEWRAWDKRTKDAEQQQAEVTQAQQKQAEAWNAELKRYNEGKSSLPFPDVDDAEQTIVSTLSEVQQGVLVAAAAQPAKLMYALAKHPERLTALAQQTNLIKFAADVARLEGQLKMTKKRKAPDPERIERGSGSTVKQTDKHLEKLEKEAERTKDRSKLIAYKQKKKLL